MKLLSLLIAIALFSFVPTAYADVCTSAAKGPNLYQITRTKTAATLYFTPINNQIKGYTIVYGFQAGDEKYSATFDYGNSTGAIAYTVNNLDPQFSYSFNVRANNTCGTGSPWSGWVGDKYTPPSSVKSGAAIPVTGSETIILSLATSLLLFGSGIGIFAFTRRKS